MAWLLAWSRHRRRSSVVERTLGKGEVECSIHSGGTTNSLENQCLAGFRKHGEILASSGTIQESPGDFWGKSGEKVHRLFVSVAHMATKTACRSSSSAPRNADNWGLNCVKKECHSRTFFLSYPKPDAIRLRIGHPFPSSPEFQTSCAGRASTASGRLVAPNSN